MPGLMVGEAAELLVVLVLTFAVLGALYVFDRRSGGGGVGGRGTA